MAFQIQDPYRMETSVMVILICERHCSCRARNACVYSLWDFVSSVV